jgi:hypothetical protein
MPHAPDNIEPGQLYGPVTLRAGEYLNRSVDIFIGKAVCDLSASPDGTG